VCYSVCGSWVRYSVHRKSAPVPAILTELRFNVFVSFVDDDMTDQAESKEMIQLLRKG
jgi:hypothetical protein